VSVFSDIGLSLTAIFAK